MQALLNAVVELATLISPAKAHNVASALRGCAYPGDAPAPNTLADTPAARAAAGRLMAAWGDVQVNGDELAGMLVGAAEARLRAEQELSVELVWTGPTTRFVPTRRTEQVLLDLIASAARDVFLVSFVAYNVQSVVAALNNAASRGIRIRLLFEASTRDGHTLKLNPVLPLHARVPSAEVLMWKKKPAPFVDGRVHAKIAVVDGARAFITSANLTGHALEKNMEAGVLIRGGSLPSLLLEHLEALAATGIITPADR